MTSRTDWLKTLPTAPWCCFTEAQINKAVLSGKIPADWSDGLKKLVTEKNDIAVIPAENLPEG